MPPGGIAQTNDLLQGFGKYPRMGVSVAERDLEGRVVARELGAEMRAGGGGKGLRRAMGMEAEESGACYGCQHGGGGTPDVGQVELSLASLRGHLPCG